MLHSFGTLGKAAIKTTLFCKFPCVLDIHSSCGEHPGQNWPDLLSRCIRILVSYTSPQHIQSLDYRLLEGTFPMRPRFWGK
jgi:hypothetical protein